VRFLAPCITILRQRSITGTRTRHRRHHRQRRHQRTSGVLALGDHRRASAQVIVHELRSPTAEALAAQTLRCHVLLPNRLDEEIIRRRIRMQAGGRQLTVLRSTNRVQAWNMPSPMASTALESVQPPPQERPYKLPAPRLTMDVKGVTINPTVPPRIWAALSSGDPRPPGLPGRCLRAARGRTRGLWRFVRGDSLAPSDRTIRPRPGGTTTTSTGWTRRCFTPCSFKSSPTHYIEIGSGPATYFARRAISITNSRPISFRSMRQCRPTRPFSATKVWLFRPSRFAGRVD